MGLLDWSDIERLAKKAIRGNGGATKFYKFVLKLLDFYAPELVKAIRAWVVEAEQVWKDGSGDEKKTWVLAQLKEHMPGVELNAEVHTIIELAVQILPRKLVVR
jgi:hypothetical protein